MASIGRSRLLRRALLGLAVAVSAAPAAAASVHRHILLIDSFGREFAPYNAVASTFRTELAGRSPDPIDFFEVSLETIRPETADETAVADYLRAVCARRDFSLVVVNGGPAVRFWLRHRYILLPAAPMLVAGAEERHLKELHLSANDAAVAIRVDLADVLRHVLDLLPGTDNLFVVLGDTPIERFWVGEVRRAWETIAPGVRITFLNEISFEAIRRRAAALPPHSAIFFALMLVDAAGVPHGQESAVDLLHAGANAPIFGWSDNFLGHGIVGGPLIPVAEVGRRAARVAGRILSGERPAGIERAVVGAGGAAYDWRELQRWGIDEARLPAGSTILFRPPSFFRQYRWQLLAALGVIATQTAAIVALLALRRRRRRAEEESQRLRAELAHAGRVSVMGQLASSLAHELNQPLGAILRNAEAAELFLAARPPNLEEIRAILADIRKDDERAGGVIDGMRALLRRHEVKMAPVGLNTVVEEVVALARADAQARHVTLAVDLDRDLPPVLGDQVQLKQVLLNLMVNGMEAMEGVPEGARTLAVATLAPSDGWVEIEVTDCGPGIPAGEIPRIFETFYTTKADGMGMGLAICKRIVAAHGGRIGVENGAAGGATVRVSLPAMEARP